MRYLIVANEIGFIYRHFWELSLAIRRQEWELFVACAAEHWSPKQLNDAGINFIRIKPTFGIGKPWAEAASILELRKVIRSVRPDILHLISLKNILLGGVLGRTERVPAVLCAQTGLGTLFAEDKFAYRCLRPAVLETMRFVLGHENAVLALENSDDRAFFIDKRVVNPQRSAIIPGAGVPPDEVCPGGDKGELPIILCISRMIRSKGILQLAEAARILREKGYSFEVHLVGGTDPRNPTSLTPDEIQRIQEDPSVKWHGVRSDPDAFLRKASIFCSPTYGREGIPRSLIEAAAAGLPIVTTDVPGCREIVRDRVTGFLVPPREIGALADALARLLESDQLRQRMGTAGRQYFEERFTTTAVLGAFSHCYSLLAMPLSLKLPAANVAS